MAVSYDGDGMLSGVGAMSVERDATAGTEQGTTLTSGGGTVATSQRYNAYGEVVSRGSTYGGGAGLSFAYGYDTFGRVRHVSESGEGAGEERWYGYDADGRLVSVCATATCNDGGVSTESEHYAYDANGNRTSWSNGAGSFTVPSSGGVDAQDRLLRFDVSGGGSVTIAYDNLGRTTGRVKRDASDAVTESTTLVYDSDGALRSFTRTGADAVSVTYDQDAVGRRLARRVGGSVTARWLYRGIHPVAEYDASWVLRRVFVYGTRGHVPDYVLASEGGTWVPYRVVTDHLGSVRRVVRVSDGAVMQRMSYDAYGRVLDDVIASGWSALPFGYAGGLYDRETGLVRFGARDYDAEVGRWTAKDPIGFRAGSSNHYGYVGQSPLTSFDPSGLEGEGIGDFVEWLADVIWMAPTNVVGGVMLLAHWELPPSDIEFVQERRADGLVQQNIVQVYGSFWATGADARTVGNFIFLRQDRRDVSPDILGHERLHIKQHEYLGAVYIPAHLTAMACSAVGSLDDNRPDMGGSDSPYARYNWLEEGPYQGTVWPW